jgi:hypothetical protein
MNLSVASAPAGARDSTGSKPVHGVLRLSRGDHRKPLGYCRQVAERRLSQRFPDSLVSRSELEHVLEGQVRQSQPCVRRKRLFDEGVTQSIAVHLDVSPEMVVDLLLPGAVVPHAMLVTAHVVELEHEAKVLVVASEHVGDIRVVEEADRVDELGKLLDLQVDIVDGDHVHERVRPVALAHPRSGLCLTQHRLQRNFRQLLPRVEPAGGLLLVRERFLDDAFPFGVRASPARDCSLEEVGQLLRQVRGTRARLDHAPCPASRTSFRHASMSHPCSGIPGGSGSKSRIGEENTEVSVAWPLFACIRGLAAIPPAL